MKLEAPVLRTASEVTELQSEILEILTFMTKPENGVACAEALTPYLLALYIHLPGMLTRCRDLKIPLKSFCCEVRLFLFEILLFPHFFFSIFFSALSMKGGEKKNHIQTTLYFHKTMRDGGWSTKSAVMEIVELENRVAQCQLFRGNKEQGKEVTLLMSYSSMGLDEPLS